MCGDDTGGSVGSCDPQIAQMDADETAQMFLSASICVICGSKPGTFRERLSRMARQVPWKPIAILTSISTVLLSLLLLPACCCVKGPLAPIGGPPKIETP